MNIGTTLDDEHLNATIFTSLKRYKNLEVAHIQEDDTDNDMNEKLRVAFTHY